MAMVKVTPMHFLEKFEECLMQDIANGEFPIFNGAVIRRFLNFPKNKVKICIYDNKHEEILAKVEIYDLPKPGNKTALKGIMVNFTEEKEENLFFLMNGTGNLAIEAYKSYQNFQGLFGIGSSVSESTVEDESDEPTDEEIAQILDMSGSDDSTDDEIAKILDMSGSDDDSDAVSEDFLQSVLQQAEESKEESSETLPEEETVGEYSVSLSPDDLLKTIQDD